MGSNQQKTHPKVPFADRSVLVCQVFASQDLPAHLALHAEWVVHLGTAGDVVLGYLLPTLSTNFFGVL